VSRACEEGADGSRQLSKAVNYNFLVVEGRVAAPTSSLDRLNGVVEFEDVSAALGDARTPAVVIKVIDREARCE
jgi:kinesin family protein 1